MKKKVISILLTIVMLIGIIPPGGICVFAEDAPAVTGKYIVRSWNSGKVISSEEDIPSNAQEIKTDTNELAGGWYVVSESITNENRIVVTGTAGNPTNIVLMDGAVLDAKAGIELAEGNVLNIYGQANDSGAINTTSEYYEAGIGGGREVTGGTLTVYGGTISATGGNDAAGIGGGHYGSGGNFTMYGGTVTATSGGFGTGSGGFGTGIGGGVEGTGGNFTMYGGTVIAEGQSAGIDGSGSGVYIDVYGGTVNATGSNVGIGGDGSSVIVINGTITATGENTGIGGTGSSVIVINGTINAAGDSAGIGGTDSSVTVSGGSVSASSSTGSGIGCGSFAINSGTVTAVSEDGAGIKCSNIVLNNGTVTASSKYSAAIDYSEEGSFFVSDTLEIKASDRFVTVEEYKVYRYGYVYIAPPTCNHSFTGAAIDHKNGTHSQKCTQCGEYGPEAKHVFLNGFCTACNAEARKYIVRSWDIGKGQVVSSEEHIPDNIKEITKDTAELAGGWYVLSESLETNTRIVVTGTAGNPTNIVLMDGAVLNAKAGIELTKGHVLNIYGQANDTGAIIAAGKNVYAGIGSGEDTTGGTLVVYGGMITATGGTFAAAIGGGFFGNGGTFRIYGGTVAATSEAGAGIGGGLGGETGGYGGTFRIYGGTVSAISVYGAGIGGGENAYGHGEFSAADHLHIKAGNSFILAEEYKTSRDGSVYIAPHDFTGNGIDNGDGTHLLKCSECGVQSEEKHVFVNGFCTACGAEQGTYFKLRWDTENELLVSSEAYIPVDAEVITGNAAALSGGWYVVNGEVTIDERITVSGEVNLVLKDGCKLNLNKGLEILTGGSLSIYGQAESTGELKTPKLSENIPAIGVGTGAELTVHGGKIYAYGGNYAAGIGGGYRGDSGDVTVYGGSITAYGGANGAGIGGGDSGAGGTFTIYGGKVDAHGSYSSGIGGGQSGAGGTIIINGGEVGSGGNIGSGYQYGPASGSTVVINGGTVSVTGDNSNVGGNGSTVEINGGEVKIAQGTLGVGYNGSNCNITIRGGTINSFCYYYPAVGGTANNVKINIYGGSIKAESHSSDAIVATSVKVYPDTEKCERFTLKDFSGNELSDSPIIEEKNITDILSENKQIQIDYGFVHTFTGDYVDNNDGTHSRKCAVCGELSEAQSHAFENHTCVCGTKSDHSFNGEYKDNGDGTHSRKCTECDEYGKTVNHSFENHTCVCGAKSDHNFTGEYKDNGNGTHSRKCTECDEYGNPEAHIFDEHHSCVCGSKYYGKYIARSWNSGKVISSEEYIPSNAQEIKTDTTELSGGWYMLSESFETHTRIVVRGTADNPTNIVLMDGAVLDAKAGIELAEGNVLNIYGQANDSGAIIAAAEYHELAGIGGSGEVTGGTLTVYGGTISATGGVNAAGIGGGTGGNGGTFTMYGGIVTATSKQGASIGGGVVGNGGAFTVYGGTVTATSNGFGAGIGGGIKEHLTGGTGGSVTVYGGIVTAASNQGAGIGGGGGGGDGGYVTINGGTVTASSAVVAGIGGGRYSSDHGELTVADGSVIKAGDTADTALDTTVNEYRNIRNHYVSVTVPHKHNFTGDYVDNGDGTHSRKCTGCDELSEAVNHTYVNGVCVCGAKATKVYVAQVGDIKYETFADAVKAADYKVITLLADVEYELAENQTIKLYENGKTATITAPEGYEVYESTTNDVTTYTAVNEQGFITTWAQLQAVINKAPDAQETSIQLTQNLVASAGDSGIVIPKGKRIVLDLNGFVLDRALTEKTENGYVILVSSNAELTINDSNPTKQNGKYSGGVITGGNNKKSGGGIWVNGGKVTMNGGTIAGNMAITTNGGGVSVSEVSGYGKFIMNGGTITDNYAYSGGAVSAASTTELEFTGGIITGNNALSKAGGVYVGSYKTVCKVGGSIKIQDNYCLYKLKGATRVIPNGDEDKGVVKKLQNVYLSYINSTNYAKISISDVTPTTMQIGLCEETKATAGKELTIIDALDNDLLNTITQYISLDNSDYYIVSKNGSMTLVANCYLIETGSIKDGMVQINHMYFDADSFDKLSDEERTVTVTVIPNKNFKLKENSLQATYGSNELTLTPVANNTFTFVMPASNVKITAEFEKSVTHTHSFAEAWTTNGTAHWHKCTAEDCDIEDYSACGLEGVAYGKHTFVGNICTTCGYFDLDTYKVEKIGEIDSFVAEKVPEITKNYKGFTDKLAQLKAYIDNGTDKNDVDERFAKVLKALDDFIPETHTVTVTGGATITTELVPEKSTKYYVATVSIKEDNGVNENGAWFVYWKDQDGKIVSTYSTYQFFAVENRTLTPVYVSPDKYDEERAKAVIVTDIVRTTDNNDGTVTLFAEHSVSKAAVGTILQHGIIYTTDSDQKDNLTLDDQSVKKAAAFTSANALTGLFRTTVNAGEADKVYARTYLVDADGNKIYGEMKEIDVSKNIETTSFASNTLETVLVQAEEIIPEVQEETETAPAFMTILMNIINAILSLFKSIIALF